jgi:hypothetical protein
MKIILNQLSKSTNKHLLKLNKLLKYENSASITSSPASQNQNDDNNRHHHNHHHPMAFLRQFRRHINAGGKTSTLLLSPAEANKILRTNESSVDLESKCPIKYYDVNYLGANNPPEDRQAQAKFLNSNIYLFGVFDGHGGYYWYYC